MTPLSKKLRELHEFLWVESRQNLIFSKFSNLKVSFSFWDLDLNFLYVSICIEVQPLDSNLGFYATSPLTLQGWGAPSWGEPTSPRPNFCYKKLPNSHIHKGSEISTIIISARGGGLPEPPPSHVGLNSPILTSKISHRFLWVYKAL